MTPSWVMIWVPSALVNTVLPVYRVSLVAVIQSILPSMFFTRVVLSLVMTSVPLGSFVVWLSPMSSSDMAVQDSELDRAVAAPWPRLQLQLS